LIGSSFEEEEEEEKLLKSTNGKVNGVFFGLLVCGFMFDKDMKAYRVFSLATQLTD
jgi:hypothetical protein